MAEKAERCDCNILHAKTVERVSGLMPGENEVEGLRNCSRCWGIRQGQDTVRALSFRNVCLRYFRAAQYDHVRDFHQLKILKQARLVKYRRDGKVVFYSLDDSHINSLFGQALEHISELK